MSREFSMNKIFDHSRAIYVYSRYAVGGRDARGWQASCLPIVSIMLTACEHITNKIISSVSSFRVPQIEAS